jgi:hypothetical protein
MPKYQINQHLIDLPDLSVGEMERLIRLIRSAYPKPRTSAPLLGRKHKRAYKSWVGLRQRCTNPDNPSFAYYGGKGVTFCERWECFDNFLSDMGDPAPGLTLERIDVNGNYSPENCRWATKKEQSRNRTTSRFITAFGKTRSLVDWCQETGLNPSTLSLRIDRYHWSPEEAISTKPQPPARGISNAANFRLYSPIKSDKS